MQITPPAASRRHLGLAVFTLYLVCLYAAAVWFGLQNLREQGSYNIADWLINYSGGFVRRGLPGQLALLLSRTAHVDPARIIFALQLVQFFALYVAVWLLIRNLRWHVWTAALAFSPATLGFVALVGGGAFRKELLFLLALTVLLLLLQRGVSDSNIVCYLTAVAVVIALSHEGLIVYWPYLLAAVAISRQSLQTSIKLGLVPTIVLVALVAFVSRHPGNLAQAKTICASIGSVYAGRDVGLCGGSIAFLGEPSTYYRFQVANSIRTNHYLRDYSLVALLAFLPCAAAIVQIGRIPAARQKLQLLLLWATAGLLCSTPLFVLAIDWGRWLYVDVFSWALLLFFLSASVDPPLQQAAPGKLSTPRAVFMAALLAVYLVTWHVPVTGYEGRGWGYLGMAKRHLQRMGHHQA